MTRKELNAIRHAAYMEWTKGGEASHLLATTAYTTFAIYKVSEDDKVKLLVLPYKMQLNNVTLGNLGFSAAATARCLFTANRQTKTLGL